MTDVIAHRGCHRPDSNRENTIPAFERAVELGVAGVELDARLSADGVIVVHHGAHLDDGRAIVDVPAGALPSHVPTLDAALDACFGVFVNIEIKNDPADPDFDHGDACASAVVALLAERGEPRSTWLISSFWRPTIECVRQLDPSLATAWLTVGPVSADEAAELVAAGHAAVHPWVPTVDAAMIERCHAVGLRVNTWTCNDEAVAQQLIADGIDGICTDIPGDLLALGADA